MSYKTYEVRVYDDGYIAWYKDGKLHREDGPAVEYSNGTKYWYKDGANLTENQFNERTNKTNPSCVGEICVCDVIKLCGKKYILEDKKYIDDILHAQRLILVLRPYEVMK